MKRILFYAINFISKKYAFNDCDGEIWPFGNEIGAGNRKSITLFKEQCRLDTFGTATVEDKT